MDIIRYLMELCGVDMTVIHRAILLEVIVWAVMIGAVVIDYRTGIRKAQVLKIPLRSHSMRKSFTKFGDYGKVACMLMFVDLLAIPFGIYTLPYASAVAAVGVVYTEYKSVRENLAAIHSSAVKVTEIVQLLAAQNDPKQIVELLKQYNTVKDAADKHKDQKPQNE